jgi:hypothetical protein
MVAKHDYSHFLADISYFGTNMFFFLGPYILGGDDAMMPTKVATCSYIVFLVA